MRRRIVTQTFRKLARLALLQVRRAACQHLHIKGHVQARFAVSMACRMQLKLVGRLFVLHNGRALSAIGISQPLVRRVSWQLTANIGVAKRLLNTSVRVRTLQTLMGSMPRCCHRGQLRAAHSGNARSTATSLLGLVRCTRHTANHTGITSLHDCFVQVGGELQA